MRNFAQLISALESTNKTNAKLDAMVQYLQTAPDADKLWFVALFTGKRPKRNVSTALMKDWAIEIAQIPYWLFVESYSSVGDLGETLSLVLPAPSQVMQKTLSEWMQEIISLTGKSDEEKKNFVLNAWDGLDFTERFIFNKLLGGSFRIGVSSKMLVNALAKYSDNEPTAIMHSIMGKWSVETTDFEDLISGKNSNPDLSKPYPFCLAYPLEKEITELGNSLDWAVEYKWDGIRGQFIKREDEVFIWSRGEELVTPQFPEIADALQKIPGDFVIDGEILVVKNGEVLNFNELQKRLNRKNIPKKMLEELPVAAFVYDLIELNSVDLRTEPFQQRRQKLETWMLGNPSSALKISDKIKFNDWAELNDIRENARDINAEGLMLKNQNSHYHSGRKKGDWWKWKISPLTIDAVLIYAQKGSGRRSSYYTDYTFAVKDGDKLVTLAKAYSGLTDKEIMEVSKFVNANAVEKYGPVKTVKPELVFEIAFEGIGFSSRHKSGVAVRFPRIVRWRKDKTVDEIDELEEIKKWIK